MKKYRLWLVLALVVGLSILQTACVRTLKIPENVLSGVPSTVTAIIKNVEPTLVRIDSAGPGVNASGSGFIVDARGYILTNNHVITKATLITVTLMNGDSYVASVVNADTARDLALLKIESGSSDLKVAVLGTSANVAVGDDVLTGGFPLGTKLPGPATFGRGIVSALRTLQGLNYIQTDSIFNPGDSGGCLFDLNGRVIGILTSGIVPPGIDAEAIGLTIPIDEARSFLQKSLPR